MFYTDRSFLFCSANTTTERLGVSSYLQLKHNNKQYNVRPNGVQVTVNLSGQLESYEETEQIFVEIHNDSTLDNCLQGYIILWLQ